MCCGWNGNRRNSSGKCGRHALVPSRDRGATYSRLAKLMYNILKESPTILHIFRPFPCFVLLVTVDGCCIVRLKRDGTRAETGFRLSPKRTSQFKSAGASV